MMKLTVSLVIVLSLGFISCKKIDIPNPIEQSHDTTTLISGKWHVLRDSVSNIGNFYITEGGITGIVIPGVYFGTPADYYDFNINGTVYLFENNHEGSSTYQVLPNSKLFVAALTVYPPGDILTLNANTLTLFWASTSANGGIYARMLYLVK